MTQLIPLITKEGNETKYQESKLWEMNISLAELIKANPICLFDENYKIHKSDDCYGRYQLYLMHPDATDSYCEIGVTNDGFVYDGDVWFPPDRLNSFPKIPVHTGLKILEAWRNLIAVREDLESELTSITENACVNIIISHDYVSQKSFKKSK